VLAVSLAAGPASAPAPAAARAINLRLSDLPGFAASSAAGPAVAVGAAARCIASPGASAAPFASPTFAAGSGPAALFVASSVSVAASPSAASSALGPLRGPAVAGCLTAALRLTTTADGLAIAVVDPRARSLTLSPAGAGGVVYEATATLAGSAVSVPLALDVEAFVVGSTEVTLTTASLAQPFPAALAARLRSVLSGRALSPGGASPAPSAAPAAPSSSHGTLAG
jgi:hypothetical protein